MPRPDFTKYLSPNPRLEPPVKKPPPTPAEISTTLALLEEHFTLDRASDTRTIMKRSYLRGQLLSGPSNQNARIIRIAVRKYLKSLESTP